MAERKPFLLRLDPGMLEALQHWAADDLRSLNGQIEFLLRRALLDAGRVRASERAHPRAHGRAAPPGEAGQHRRRR